MMKLTQYITAGSQFGGVAPDGTYTVGGLFQIPFSGSSLVCARLRKLMFKTPGTLTSFTWSQQLWDSGHLNYDNLSNIFHVGRKLTGGTSGATAKIVRDNASQLYLGEIAKGPTTGQLFLNDEAITEDGAAPQGSALANGTVTFDTVAIDTGAATDTDYELAFGNDEGLLENDGNAAVEGTPVPVLFVSVGLTDEAVATLMYDYVTPNSNPTNYS